MARRSTMARWGIPILAVVLILTVAIARVGAGDGNNEQNDDSPGDERQVEHVTIESVDVRIAESYPVQVFVEATGYTPDPCWEAQTPSVVEDGTRIVIEIFAERDPEEICSQVIQEYHENIPLDTMEPGEYKVVVNGVEREFEVD